MNIVKVHKPETTRQSYHVWSISE